MKNPTLGKVIAVLLALVVIAAIGAGIIVTYKKYARAAEVIQQANDQMQAVKDQQKKMLEPRALPEFALTDQNGDGVTLYDMKGKVWLADFIFTECPGQCIMLSNHFKNFQSKLAGMENVRLVSITVDPEVDTPEKLLEYGKKYQAGNQWMFLTGDRGEIYDLAKRGFYLNVTPNPEPEAGGDKIFHTTKVVLVDADGNIRKYYDGLPEDIHDEVLADIREVTDTPKDTQE